ncbi:MAG: AzlC family ABC transporter permease [Lachnospiraceae bacterium]|nr:AzlC family ABC transporter permease [Lachnospiraceae bacterium]
MKLLKKVMIKTFPVLTGYLVLGMGFGILMIKNEFGILAIVAMSLFIYAGSMQYVGITLLTAGAGVFQTALTTLMVNARHLFYGISMVEKYRETGIYKPYLIFALTDETYSLVCNEEKGEDSKTYFFLVSLCNHFYWVAGSLIGGVLGNMITFDTTGIEFSMTALFLTVFVEQWLGTKQHFPALSGLSCSVLCLFLFGKDKFLIPTMVLITVSLLINRKKYGELTKE